MIAWVFIETIIAKLSSPYHKGQGMSHHTTVYDTAFFNHNRRCVSLIVTLNQSVLLENVEIINGSKKMQIKATCMFAPIEFIIKLPFMSSSQL